MPGKYSPKRGLKTVLPLALEEVRKLLHCAVLVVVSVADSNQRRVPRPLVRVEAGSWLGVLPVPVEVEYHLGLLNELLIRFLHRVRLLLQKSPTRATLTRVANSSRLEEHPEAYSPKCLEKEEFSEVHGSKQPLRRSGKHSTTACWHPFSVETLQLGSSSCTVVYQGVATRNIPTTREICLKDETFRSPRRACVRQFTKATRMLPSCSLHLTPAMCSSHTIPRLVDR